MKKAIILGGGTIASFALFSKYSDGSDIICVDKGCDYAIKHSLDINIAIGDFDSINQKNIATLADSKIPRLEFDANKDFTDMELAINYCVDKEYDQLYIFGALGTRLDHTMMNIELLSKFEDDFSEIFIIDEHNIIFPVSGKRIIEKKEGYFLSFLVAKSNPEITLSGVKWPLHKKVLSRGESLTISNEIISDRAIVAVENGTCFGFLSRD